MSRERFMRRAIELSRENMEANRGGPFGAVVVRDGEIVGEGWNAVTSTNDPTAHAEVMAIREACRSLSTFTLAGCELYTSCEPCPMCLASAYWARVDRILFANTQDDAAGIDFDDAFLYREIALPPDGRSLPMERFMGEEALEVFREWAVKPDKTPY